MPDGTVGIGRRRNVALVLSGGVGLGAYEAGAYAALHDQPGLRPSWVAGSSAGAVNAAIIAGNPPERRVDRLREFWEGVSEDPYPAASFWSFWLGTPDAGPWRQALNEKSALDTLLFGRPQLFRPRLAPGPQVGARDVRALFDLEPLRAQLLRLVDWDRLNGGEVRLGVSCTDVVSGERVAFDTGHGDRIGVEHVLGSCALLPVFAPVEVEGRLLADGGLGANAPLDLVLDGSPDAGPDQETLCLVVELFARQGSRPRTLAASASRAADLAFGNQTRRILEGREREYRLRGLISELAELLPEEVRADPDVARVLSEGRASRTTVATVAYRGGLDEAGLFKPFDFSHATLADRWRAGEAAMLDAVASADRVPGETRPALSVVDA